MRITIQRIYLSSVVVTHTAQCTTQSGSTGKPKGVIINHSQVVAGCASADVGFGIREGEEVYLAYLPLAHIMELMAECVMISKGCALCFADPKSLTATGAYPIGALEVYSPTVMVAVPKIWDVISKGIKTKVAAESPIKQELVATALTWRKFCLKHGFDAPLFDKVVFKKFKKAVGGRLRLAVSGGGPLNGEVQDFIRTAFGISLVQGYVSRNIGRCCKFRIESDSVRSFLVPSTGFDRNVRGRHVPGHG